MPSSRRIDLQQQILLREGTLSPVHGVQVARNRVEGHAVDVSDRYVSEDAFQGLERRGDAADRRKGRRCRVQGAEQVSSRPLAVVPVGDIKRCAVQTPDRRLDMVGPGGAVGVEDKPDVRSRAGGRIDRRHCIEIVRAVVGVGNREALCRLRGDRQAAALELRDVGHRVHGVRLGRDGHVIAHRRRHDHALRGAGSEGLARR